MAIHKQDVFIENVEVNNPASY